MTTALAPRRTNEPEFEFTSRDFDWFAALVYAHSGIVLGAAKTQLVYSRIAKRVRATGCDTFARYIALVDENPAERDEAIYALTTNHTKFFRENHHFEHFVEAAWPKLAARLAGGGKVRIWSAACSSGEEPYTLAMAVLGRNRDAAKSMLRSNLRILATDLAPAVLAIGRAGRYPADTLAAMPADLRGAWVKRDGDSADIDPAIRDLIAFKQLNLLGDWPIRNRFDAIFCRNVMIYFDDETKSRLQERLCAQLEPGGFLYIGHSERIIGPAASKLTPIGNTIYVKA